MSLSKFGDWVTRDDREMHVYLLHFENGHSKIGVTVDLDNRCNSLRTQANADCEVVFSRMYRNRGKAHWIEKFLHMRYLDLAIPGQIEWFSQPIKRHSFLIQLGRAERYFLFYEVANRKPTETMEISPLSESEVAQKLEAAIASCQREKKDLRNRILDLEYQHGNFLHQLGIDE